MHSVYCWLIVLGIYFTSNIVSGDYFTSLIASGKYFTSNIAYLVFGIYFTSNYFTSNIVSGDRVGFGCTLLMAGNFPGVLFRVTLA